MSQEERMAQKKMSRMQGRDPQSKRQMQRHQKRVGRGRAYHNEKSVPINIKLVFSTKETTGTL